MKIRLSNLMEFEKEEGAAMVKTVREVDRVIGELQAELAMLQAAIIDSGAAK